MLSISEYYVLPLKTRQEHLNLEEPCVNRGGDSRNHKGVLAQFLNTPIYGRPFDLCHRCHNGNCSNPRHLYWGTRSENVKDAIENGSHILPINRKGPSLETCIAGGKSRKGMKLT